MPGQYPDKKTVGIPPDLVLTRHDTELFMLRAENAAFEAEGFKGEAAASADESESWADKAQQYAAEAEAWSELHSQGVHFAPTEPDVDKRYDGMLWLQTNESAHTITAVKRFDASSAGSGTYLSDDLYLSDELYLNDSGAWTSFTFDL